MPGSPSSKPVRMQRFFLATVDLDAASAGGRATALRFLALKGLDAAKRAVKAIREGVNILGDRAYAGRPAEGMEPPFREWPISFGAGSYIVLYRVEGDEVSLLAIRSGREAGFPGTV